MKIGIVVVAYNAERTLSATLDRIEPAFAKEVAEILVLDDYSTDKTASVAARYAEDHPELPITVVSQERNLGYGGNQKSGYSYAMEHGWDVAVMLHGDGQYAPELLAVMVEPIVEGRADAVFGSRMMIPRGAIEGGMPRYKYIGNRVLTKVQNSLTGLDLTEWHSGYRAYSVSVLSQLPLESTSDGFDFDTEIILQLHSGGHRIEEVPISTSYGDEVCHVNGMAYARDIVIHTARYSLGRRGFGAGALAQPEPYQHKTDPSSSHGVIMKMVENRRPQRVLDIGCGPGWLASVLTAQGHDVTGVDLFEYPGVASRMSKFVRADLERGVPDEVGSGFELILAADVLEHVREPDRVLRTIVDLLGPKGTIILSVPNISHWYPRLRFTLGLFGYDQRGILDRTHVRFFTRRTLKQMLHRANLGIIEMRTVGLPFDALQMSDGPRSLTSIVRKIDGLLASWWPNMFACQYVLEIDRR